MLEGLNQVDWKKYQYGQKIPDLLIKLISDDWNTRQNAWSSLSNLLESTYEKNGSEFPLVVIPFLIEILKSPNVPDRAIITDLLIFLSSYSEIETLEEPYKTEALRLKQAICEGGDIYQSLVEDESIKEDIDFLLSACQNPEKSKRI
jgi:hypothetical protein